MRRQVQTGVTLVELVVVLVVLAILALAVIPSLGNLLRILESKGAAEEVAGAIRLARQHAITAGGPHCIRFTGSPNTTYTIFSDAACTEVLPGYGARKIGHGYAIIDPEDAEIVFTPVGTLQGGGTFDLTVDSSPPPVCPSTVHITIFGGVRVSHGC